MPVAHRQQDTDPGVASSGARHNRQRKRGPGHEIAIGQVALQQGNVAAPSAKPAGRTSNGDSHAKAPKHRRTTAAHGLEAKVEPVEIDRQSADEHIHQSLALLAQLLARQAVAETGRPDRAPLSQETIHPKRRTK
jgi:hypothetical protein